jgi:hypothetical protein
MALLLRERAPYADGYRALRRPGPGRDADAVCSQDKSLFVATALGVIVAASLAGLASAGPNPPGNNGTIKIDDVLSDDLPNNEPHDGCSDRCGSLTAGEIRETICLRDVLRRRPPIRSSQNPGLHLAPQRSGDGAP